MNINAIVLAAGKGTRMKSNYPKVIHKLLGKPMIMHVIDNLKKADVNNIISVVGFEAKQVEDVVLDNSKYVYQNEQLGTGHAIMMCDELLKNDDGITIIICGDTPLITNETITALIDHHNKNKNDCTILSGILDDALAYGRIVRDGNNNVEKIVEFKDASEKEKEINEFNTGTYIFDNKLLFKYISKINNQNAQNEYYLTDVISLMYQDNKKVDGCILKNLDETIGINDRATLAYAAEILRDKINLEHMNNGVSIIDPKNTYISIDTTIDFDTTILPGSVIFGETTIGSGCEIGPNTELVNTTILNNTKIMHSHIYDCIIKNNVQIGPYARMRNNCVVEDNCKIGNFVEFKKALYGNGSKASHLTYVGDAIVGENVNLGCGTITVNYDGKNKFETIIEDDVFIGCNSNLIAPVTIERGAIIAAATTITKNVPEDALAIGRVKQENKNDFASKFK